MKIFDKKAQELFEQFIDELVATGILSRKEGDAAKKHHDLPGAVVDTVRAELSFKKFGQYENLIPPPDKALREVEELNHRYWNDHFSQETLSRARARLKVIPNHHVQSVTDLFSYHVVIGSAKETIEMWYPVYKDKLPDVWMEPQLDFGPKHFRLHPLAATYREGIHLVRINLAAHWDTKHGCTLAQVQDDTGPAGEVLAQLELLSIFGVHTKLFMAQDGEKLPFTTLPGTVLIGPGGQGASALTIHRLNQPHGFNGAEFDIVPTNHRSRHSAAPILLKIPR